ncbi:MAG: hypothetical protein QOI66_2983 [Myxococcales bacterium]|jgi:hypothetical protein|nr:hypothetical protein [Myxococcales bacterium]
MRILVTVEGKKAWQGKSGRVGSPRKVMIGSARPCDVILDGTSVAALHAELAIDESGIWLCAHSPVTIEGQAVVGWSQLTVVDAARVRIAGREIVISVVSPRRSGKAVAAPAAAVKSETQKAAVKPEVAKPETAAPAAARPVVAAPPAAVAAVSTPSSGAALGDDAVAAAAAARLAELFAMPAASKQAGGETRTFRALKWRFLRLTLSSWLMVLVSGAIGAFMFATREVPRASAGRSLRADFIPPPKNVARPAPGKKSPAPPPQTAAVAAAALVTGDFAKALPLYRRLAEVDSKFLPFVRGLEQRLKGQCTGGVGSCP